MKGPSTPSWAGRRALVTGGAGFIASHLIRALLKKGANVVATVRPHSNLWRIADLLSNIQVLEWDLAGPQAPHLPESIEVLFHLGAEGVVGGGTDIKRMTEVNVLGTVHLLQAFADKEVQRFVYSGSCAEYGVGSGIPETAPSAPISEYGASKAAGWSFVQAISRRHRFHALALRPFLVYGPFEAPVRFVPHTVCRLLQGARPRLTAGDQKLDFVYVEDVAEAFLKAADSSVPAGEVFNVCTGVETTVKEAASVLVDLNGNTIQPEYGAIPYRDTAPRVLSGNPAKAARELKWTFRTPLEEGLRKTMEWFKTEGPRYSTYGWEGRDAA